MSEYQAQLISNAVELVARLGMSQFNMLEEFFWNDLDELEKVRPLLKELQKIKTGSHRVNPGLGSSLVDEDFRVLFDLHRLIRHRLAWDREPNNTSYSVIYDEPRQESKVQPLATIETLSAVKKQVSSRNRKLGVVTNKRD